MATIDLLLTTVRKSNPTNSLTDASDAQELTSVSEFLTVQSLANFAAMSAAIAAAWRVLEKVHPAFASMWLPWGLALGWLVVSLLLSKAGAPPQKALTGYWIPLAFIGLLNSTILVAAVAGIA